MATVVEFPSHSRLVPDRQEAEYVRFALVDEVVGDVLGLARSGEAVVTQEIADPHRAFAQAGVIYETCLIGYSGTANCAELLGHDPGVLLKRATHSHMANPASIRRCDRQYLHQCCYGVNISAVRHHQNRPVPLLLPILGSGLDPPTALFPGANQARYAPPSIRSQS